MTSNKLIRLDSLRLGEAFETQLGHRCKLLSDPKRAVYCPTRGTAVFRVKHPLAGYTKFFNTTLVKKV